MWSSLLNVVVIACPICFRTDDADTVMGVRAGVVVLGAVTAVVLGGFAVFAGRLARREAHKQDDNS